MPSEKEQPKGATGKLPAPQRVDDSNVAEFYSNFVAANTTPFELNLIFARTGVPIGSPHGVEVPWTSDLKYLARVALPLQTLPLLLKLLEDQLRRAKENGMVIEEMAAEVKP